MEKVSIIIPFFNAGKQNVKRAITSALRQENVLVEIIAVDDGSTDDSVAGVVDHTNVKLLSQTNLGANAARNAGIMVAKSNWIKFLDSDDCLPANVIFKEVEYSRNKQNTIFFGSIKLVNSDGSHDTRVDSGILHVDDLINNNIQTGRSLYSRNALIDIGGFDESLKFRQEWDLNLRLASNGYSFEATDLVVYEQLLSTSALRISNRGRSAEEELGNLNRIFSKFSDDFFYRNKGFIARKYIDVARKFLRTNDNLSANLLINQAKEIAGKNYLKAYPLVYRIINSILGFQQSERLINFVKKLR